MYAAQLKSTGVDGNSAHEGKPTSKSGLLRAGSHPTSREIIPEPLPEQDYSSSSPTTGDLTDIFTRASRDPDPLFGIQVGRRNVGGQLRWYRGFARPLARGRAFSVPGDIDMFRHTTPNRLSSFRGRRPKNPRAERTEKQVDFTAASPRDSSTSSE